MDGLLRFVSKYEGMLFALLFLFVMSVMTCVVIQRARRYRRIAVSFPAVTDMEVLYNEDTASGRSLKSLMTRLGGASGCLRITVTRDEVWIRPVLHGVFPASQLDLIHRFPKTTATAKRIGKTERSRKMLLEYRDASGGAHQLELRLADPDKFLSALAHSSPPCDPVPASS